jgi:hypothetical protein
MVGTMVTLSSVRIWGAPAPYCRRTVDRDRLDLILAANRLQGDMVLRWLEHDSPASSVCRTSASCDPRNCCPPQDLLLGHPATSSWHSDLNIASPSHFWP